MSDDKTILISQNSREVRMAGGGRDASRPAGRAGAGDSRRAGRRNATPAKADTSAVASHVQVVVRPMPAIRRKKIPAALSKAMLANEQSINAAVNQVLQNSGLDLRERIAELVKTNARLMQLIAELNSARTPQPASRRPDNESHNLNTLELRESMKTMKAGRKP
ncbi:hypothetical protein OAH95_04605 [Burkholderiaceae bacterium]|nr:hypothetical protein [Burkholderiaceae bacterium]